MGQKVHPTGIRLGITEVHRSKWFASRKDFAGMLKGDLLAREHIKKALSKALVSRIQIERLAGKSARIIINSARPGSIIGKKGEEIEKLKSEVSNIMGIPVQIKIEEIKRPELDAQLVADSIAQQLERRVMFRRAMKRAVSNAMRFGAKGIKVCVGGRLGGAEIARKEWYKEGRVPLHTFRADIDYATSSAMTTYGVIGVKVWIFKGEVLERKQAKSLAVEEE